MTDQPGPGDARAAAAARLAAAWSARYEAWLAEEKPYAGSTVRTYRQQLDRYLQWLAGQPELAAALDGVAAARWFIATTAGTVTSARGRDGDADVLKAAADHAAGQYQQHLQASGTAPAGVKLAMAALGSLHRAAGLAPPQIEGRVTLRPAPRPRSLTRRERRRALAAARRRGPRDLVIAVLAVEVGLRPSEIVALDDDDLTVTEEKVEIVVRPALFGHRARVMILSRDGAGATLAQYKAERAAIRVASPALLLSRRGSRMALRTAEHVIQLTGAAAGVPLSLVRLRHTAAIEHVAQGAGRAEVAAFLGYASAETARRYDPETVPPSANPSSEPSENPKS